MNKAAARCLFSLTLGVSLICAPSGNATIPTADETSIGNLFTQVLACASKRSAECLATHIEYPEALYIVNDKEEQEVHPLFAIEAFNPVHVNLFKVSNDKDYSRKIFFTSANTAEVVFYNRKMGPPTDSFEALISKSEYLQCGVTRTAAGWKLAYSVCGYIDDGN